MSLKARSGAVLTVTSLNGPFGVALAIVDALDTGFGSLAILSEQGAGSGNHEVFACASYV
jgi:hypothetical protein